MILAEPFVDFFMETRADTEKLCAPLEIEDYVVQPVADVSPPKWHLGHSSWFFEEFILKPGMKGYTRYHEDFAFIFNSYYESVGKRVIRPDRGNLSRPTVAEVYKYRKHVTAGIRSLFGGSEDESLLNLLELGIHHEKQHQELLLTDIKYILGNNPLFPIYSGSLKEFAAEGQPREWIAIDEGTYEVGNDSEGFCYDNEMGRHTVYLHPYEIFNCLVTQGEYLEFMEDGGYSNPMLWHADAREWIQQQAISAPLYWHRIDGEWHHYTLNGLQKIEADWPLTHISYYEAFAYAQWKGCRLPTEFEWESAQAYFPWGKRWEWTESAYLPYPGYARAEGALGEYNGKFMVNQKVLRGGSVATPKKHTRPTYRNFFHPHLRWQYTGIRLAR